MRNFLIIMTLSLKMILYLKNNEKRSQNNDLVFKNKKKLP